MHAIFILSSKFDFWAWLAEDVLIFLLKRKKTLHCVIDAPSLPFIISMVDTKSEADSVAVQCHHNLDFTQPISTTTFQEEKNGAALG